ncbi:MAG: hypothetical protein O3B01_09760 [Planctomycetota bacterium]|nr:hypothetical protein [Planctomycetota bacterium]MDA1138855.1 hypothetical protein [Planctomycetota bacterium]
MKFPWRALLISIVLAVISAFWLSYTELWWKLSSFAVSAPIPLPAIAGLLLLMVLKGVMTPLFKRWSFTRQEVLLVYCFLIISVPLASYGLAQQFIPHLTAPFFYGDDQNGVAGILKHIPDWARPDQDAIQSLYEKSEDGIPWRSWIGPIAGWGALLFFIYGFGLCLSVLISDQWMQAERLRFPLAVPALELTEEGKGGLLLKPLVKDCVFWIGVAGSVGFNTLRIFHEIDPDFPAPNWMWVISFSGEPWSKMDTIYMYYKPLVLAMAYLAPTSLSLSVWVFQCWKYIQGALGSILGISNLSGTTLSNWSAAKFPFHNEQAIGAFVFIALLSLWKARRHLLNLFIRNGSQGNDDSGKTWALAGCVICAAGGILWCLAAGFSIGVCLALAVVMLLITLTHARIRAEAGPPSYFVGPYRPSDLMVGTAGTTHFSGSEMTQLGMLGFLTSGYFPFLMATQLEALKISREGKIKRAHILAFLVCALFVGMAAGLSSTLHVYYKYGADRIGGWPIKGANSTYTSVVHYLEHPTHFNAIAFGFIGLGSTMAAGLASLRYLYYWWPLHPLGYAIAETWQSHQIWFMFFVAWAIKSAVIRYGGIRLYKRTVPIFLGLVVGQIIAVLVGCLLSGVWGFRLYVHGT